MRIKKVSGTSVTQAQVVDGYSTSTTDSYSCNYVNNRKTYVFGDADTISFTAPYSGILDIEFSMSGWGYGGAEYKGKITNTEGNATEMAYAAEKSSGHNSIPIPVRTRAFYRVEKGTTYTFVGAADASMGGYLSKWIMAKLTP